MTQELTGLINEMLDQDFTGGTLVEYVDLCKFDIEWGRATIQKIDKISDIEGINGIKIQTDIPRKATLFLKDIRDIYEITKRGEIYYLNIPQLTNYALAPKEIKIPKPVGYPYHPLQANHIV